MSKLVNITSQTPKAIQIWGFYGACTVNDVAAALTTIASTLNGDNHKIHIMSGTHGYCNGRIGAVATREQKFADQDRKLASPKTQDRKPVDVVVHDFNNGKLSDPDPVTAAMAKLNQDIRSFVTDTSNAHTFLLAYCCSAGVDKAS